MRLGFHLSIAGGHHKAAEAAARMGTECLQVFSSNPRGWRRPELRPAAAERFRAAAAAAGLHPVVVHASYLVNLASPKDELWEKSLDLLVDELERAAALGCAAVVVHPGSRMGRGLDWGLERVAAAARRALERTGGAVALWLENTPGGGGQLGGTLVQLARLLERLDGWPVGVCLDTAHAWAAGYRIDAAAPVGRFVDRVERLLGVDAVKLWHFNDIDHPRGRRRDRHTHLGQGYIGEAGFKALVGEPRLASAAVIMETPKDSAWADRRNLAYLRRIMTGLAPRRSVDTNCRV